MKKYLLDSDILIDNLNDKLPDQFLKQLSDTAEEISTLPVVLTEVYAGIVDTVDRKQADNLLGTIEVVDVTRSIGEQAGSIIAEQKKRGSAMGTVDAIIAATALEYDLTLITRNVRHYQGVPELSFVEPNKIS